MQISGRILARLALFADLRLLNPQGLSLLPIHLGLLERYKFQTYQKGDYDFAKGIRYADGQFVYDGSLIAVSLTVYNNGWLVEASMSTEVAESFFNDISDWVTGIGYASAKDLVTKKSYESQLAIQMDLDISRLFEKLQTIAHFIAQLSENPKEQLSGFYIGTETDQLSTFTFERLAGTPFSENKYFSRAMLPTAKHIRAIEEIEKILG
jgi:hypothetical protein